MHNISNTVQVVKHFLIIHILCFQRESSTRGWYLNSDSFAISRDWLQSTKENTKEKVSFGLNDSSFLWHGKVIAEIFQSCEVPRYWQQRRVPYCQRLCVLSVTNTFNPRWGCWLSTVTGPLNKATSIHIDGKQHIFSIKLYLTFKPRVTPYESWHFTWYLKTRMTELLTIGYCS